MTYDETLAARVRTALADHPGLSEKRMFGGLCFLLHSNMCCGIVDDTLMVRLGPDAYEPALARPHAREMDFTGRPLPGMVYVAPAGVRTATALASWVRRGTAFAASLPCKKARAKKKTKGVTMDPAAMAPHGRALLAYFEGDLDAELLVRRGDGREERVPVRYFFRSPEEFSSLEHAALEACRGHVLDVGAGSGLHSLALQAAGTTVTAMDISPEAVDVMTQRGVRDVRLADVFTFTAGPFDTLLLLGHGLGMVQDLAGLDRFLAHARGLVGVSGQLLLHTVDPTRTDDPEHLAYHDANRRAGRYIGEIELAFEYGGARGPSCRWLIVDPPTLQEHARRAGWDCEIVHEEPNGDYLARLTRS